MENWKSSTYETELDPIAAAKNEPSHDITDPSAPVALSHADNFGHVDKRFEPIDTTAKSHVSFALHNLTANGCHVLSRGVRMFAHILAILTMPLPVASRTSSDPPMQANLTTLADFVELAATIIPQRASDLKWRLCVANFFIPMPVRLGWWGVSERIVPRPNTFVSGLCITDVASGATKEVTAAWMHYLYQHTLDSMPLRSPKQDVLLRGTTFLRLKDVGFRTKFGWQHLVIIGTVLLQFALALYLVTSHQQREGCLLLAGILIRILHCMYDWKYPLWYPPRPVKKGRFYIVHTRMTTRHLLVLVHEPNENDSSVSIEDAATPVLRTRKGRHAWVEHICEQTLRVATFLPQTISTLTQSNGFIFPLALLFGSCVEEIISICTDGTPAYSGREDIETHESLLDMLTAACQTVGKVSVGLVESILPDPMGKHIDYMWISSILEGGVHQIGVHPDHVLKDEVLSYVRRRRNVKV
jgi:hypothetical protein